MIDPAEERDRNQGQFDLGEALHPVQFRHSLEERRQYRAAMLKFGTKHGEGHAEKMYERGLKARRAEAARERFTR